EEDGMRPRTLSTAFHEGGATLRRSRLPLLRGALALVLASACTCNDDIGTITNGVTLVDPAGPADEFERTLDLGAVRVGTLLTKRIVLRNDGAASARITKVELTSDTAELSLEGHETLP